MVSYLILPYSRTPELSCSDTLIDLYPCGFHLHALPVLLLGQVFKIVLPPRREAYFLKIKVLLSRDSRRPLQEPPEETPGAPKEAPRESPRPIQEPPKTLQELQKRTLVLSRGPQRRSKSTKSLIDSSSHTSIVL